MGCEEGRGPATVASRCAEAAGLALDDRYPGGRIVLKERASGPQSGEATADDGDIDVEVAIERVTLGARRFE